ncbi:Hsp33 family molecular chaperone HslO [Spiroplasma endosymbiont of Crioceris asparagi]|uniref:Hsp33 family molecular chaperone HslO n=1 Tax=Spiroplasma endosymbiont of Crioceris asparagi TaxID=3066286 RepID=UPI0030D5FB75
MNKILKAINNELNVSITIIEFTEGLQNIIETQKMNLISSTIFGKFFLNSILINSFNKEEKIDINIQSKTNGSIKEILVNIYDLNKVRGYLREDNTDLKNIKTSVDLFNKTFGNKGELNVFKIKEGNIISNSSIKIDSSNIDKIFMNYLKTSEQVNGILTTCIDIDDSGKLECASGILIHMLPGFSQRDIEYIEEKIGTLENLNKVLGKTKNYNYLVEDIAPNSKILKVDESFKIQCKCSEEKAKRTINLLSDEEISDIKKEKNEIEIICEFCKKSYIVNLV